MSIWNQYPYTDFHELNLDWIIKMVKEVTKEMNDFKVVNRIVWGGLHDPGKEYPRFCIVDTPTHEGYISIQPVPAGITIDNEDYWRQVANYSALYADFQNRLIALENAIPAISEDVDTLKDRVYGTNRRYVVISDSYGLGRGGTTAWTTYFQTYRNAANTDYFTFSEGSMGFNRPGDMTHTVKTLLQSKENDITDHDTITDVVIALGANDTLAASGLEDAIIDCIQYIKTEYPNAFIHIGFCGNILNKTYGDMLNYHSALNQYITACAKTDAKFISGLEIVMHDATLMQSDLVHPTTPGSEEIAKFISAYLNGESPVYRHLGASTVTSTYFSAMTVTGGVCGDNVTLTIYPYGASADLSFTGRAYVEIGTLNTPLVYPNPGMPLFGNVSGFDANLDPVQFRVKLEANKIYLSPFKTGSITIPTGAALSEVTLSAGTSFV